MDQTDDVTLDADHTFPRNTSPDTSKSHPIILSVGYQLSQWRVSDGSAVHIGETIAIIDSVQHTELETNSTGTGICNDIDVINTNDEVVQSIPTSNHKRPSRRKRPIQSDKILVNTNDNLNDKQIIEESASKATTSCTLPTSTSSVILDSKLSNSNKTNIIRDTKHTIIAQGDGIFRMNHEVTSKVAMDNELILGWIDPCHHPTVIAGLCAVCGSSITNKATRSASSFNGEHQNSHDSTTVSGIPDGESNRNQNMTLMTVSGMTVEVSEMESKRMASEDTKRLENSKKLSLVLDLDHTLLHATADPQAAILCSHRTDVRRLVLPYMPFEHNTNPSVHNQQSTNNQLGWLQQHFVKLRPHLKEFFQQLMDQYEMGVYTAGTRDYAEQIAILLSRHVMGAKRDEMELEELRQKLRETESAYERQQRTWNDISSNDNDKKSVNINSSKNDETESDEVSGVTERKIENGSKRKRVQFEPLAATIRTDAISLEVVENLRLELQEAELYEQQAHELRRKLFGSRVMSRTEAGESGRYVKSLRRIFPCGGSMAAVVDDREDVWTNTDEMNSTRIGEPPENLLLVRPYHWSLFHGFADVNNTSGMDFLQLDESSQKEGDDQLLWTVKILKSLHDRYYNNTNPDRRTVSSILSEMRSEVLKGCVVVLSGLVPLSKQQTIDNNSPRPNFVRYAEMLGAVVQTTITDDVTHVIGNNEGTEKIILARRINGCYIVKPSWLIECLWSLTRRDENDHLLVTRTNQKQASDSIDNNGEGGIQNLVDIGVNKSVEPIDDSIDDDDDDEDFATELENELLTVNDAQNEREYT